MGGEGGVAGPGAYIHIFELYDRFKVTHMLHYISQVYYINAHMNVYIPIIYQLYHIYIYTS